jgi:hypothetical protein
MTCCLKQHCQSPYKQTWWVLFKGSRPFADSGSNVQILSVSSFDPSESVLGRVMLPSVPKPQREFKLSELEAEVS